MNTTLSLSVVIVGLGFLAQPTSAYACGCGGAVSSATSLRDADLVFVGKVARAAGGEYRAHNNPDGSIAVEREPGPPIWTFDVAHVFRGRSTQQYVITGNHSDCDEPFRVGEMWLVYASSRDGLVTTNKCTRTRLLAEAESSQDLAYLQGVEQQRPQGIVYGDVLRRILGADGQPALQALFEPLQVIAVGSGRRVEITTDKWGPYQLVLPPGDFEIWVERAGRAVAPRQTVHVDHGSDRRLDLPVEYKN